MTIVAASENALAGTRSTMGGLGDNLVPGLMTEVSTSTAVSPGDQYHESAWWGHRALRGPGSRRVSPDADGNPVGRAPRVDAERIVGLKRWEGRILEISDGLFTAELTPSDHDGPELVADFDLDLLGPDSCSAGLGDIIYLTTRKICNAAGYPYETSSLKLRRPGPWGENELREIEDIAKRQAELFKGI